MSEQYSREDYEHRHCLAVTRTEDGQFVKCLVHAGDVDDANDYESPAFDRLDNSIQTDDPNLSPYTDDDVLNDAVNKDGTINDSAREHTQLSERELRRRALGGGK